MDRVRVKVDWGIICWYSLWLDLRSVLNQIPDIFFGSFNCATQIGSYFFPFIMFLLTTHVFFLRLLPMFNIQKMKVRVSKFFESSFQNSSNVLIFFNFLNFPPFFHQWFTHLLRLIPYPALLCSRLTVSSSSLTDFSLLPVVTFISSSFKVFLQFLQFSIFYSFFTVLTVRAVPTFLYSLSFFLHHCSRVSFASFLIRPLPFFHS